MKPGAGIKTIAIKVSAEDFEQKKRLAQLVLGGDEVYTEPGLSVFKLPDGCQMELYGPGSVYPDCLFEKDHTVFSFRVPDLEEAVKQARSSGMEIISKIQKLGTCLSYCYIRDKKGTVFGLTN